MKFLNLSNGKTFHCLLKFIRIMRIGIFLLFVIIAQLHAEIIYSKKATINLALKNASVQQILVLIIVKTGYKFLFTDKTVAVNRQIAVNLAPENI